jgi:hypothetical protein
MQYKYCVYMYVDGKIIIPVETIPGIGGREDKRE